jgi:hypothetical protein
MSNPTSEPGYAEVAAAQDNLLDERLAAIRRQTDESSITPLEAANARIAALEHHLATIRNLRAEYFSEERP